MAASLWTLLRVLQIVVFGATKLLLRLVGSTLVRAWTVGSRVVLFGYVAGVVYLAELQETLREAL